MQYHADTVYYSIFSQYNRYPVSGINKHMNIRILERYELNTAIQLYTSIPPNTSMYTHVHIRIYTHVHIRTYVHTCINVPT